jgi:hypothetical protein
MNIKMTAIPAQKSYGRSNSPRTCMVDVDGNLEVPWGLLLGIYQIAIPVT